MIRAAGAGGTRRAGGVTAFFILRRRAGRRGGRVGGDNFEVGVAAESEEEVVGTHPRVGAAGGQVGAEGAADELRPRGKARGGDDEVIEGRAGHGLSPGGAAVVSQGRKP